MSSGAEPVWREDQDGRAQLTEVWVLFALTWAVAVLFHLVGNTQLAPEWGKGLLGASAVAVLAAPRCRLAMAAMAAMVLVNVWLEAPLLSNHSFLHGFVAATVLAGLGTRPSSGAQAMVRLRGPLRLVLLAFYAFAAFAKLNFDFFATPVSCGVLFFEESAASWDLARLIEGWWDEAYRSVAILVATVELSVPVLLAVSRTRQGGVLLALAFHFVLAANREHQFFDFSSALVVLFLLFLAPETVRTLFRLLEGARGAVAARWRSGPELVRLGGLAIAGLVVVLSTGAERWGAVASLRDVGVWAWFAYGIASFGLVALAVRRTAVSPRPRRAPVAPAWLYLLPALAVLNGLTPYLELKTAASWNMYSNLRIVDGESNHLLVTRSLPLSAVHRRLVEIVEAEGVDLSFYIGSDWLLPEQMLLDEIADDPGVRVVGRVGGRLETYVGGRGGARPEWQRKLQVFRAVDGVGRAGCQASFGPAR